MHEGNVSPHRLQRYTFYTYYIHISCIFYAFLTHLYRIVEQGSTPSRALVLASSWSARWQLAQRATSEERARKKRGTSAPVRQPSAVALSRCRQPLPSALSRCRFASWAVEARRQVAGAAADGGAFAAGRQAAGAAAGCFALAACASLRLKLRFCPSSSSSSSAPALWGALAPFAMGAAAAAAAAVPPLWF